MFILIITLFSYISLDTFSQLDEETKPVIVDEEVEKTDDSAPPVVLSISAVGDIMTHGPQIRAQYDSEADIYDFSNNYKKVESFISQADIAFCNIETVFAGQEKKYSSYPMFNTPDSLVDALKDVGFDIAVTSNNHCYDRGAEGVIRTIQTIRDRDIMVVGTNLEDEQDFFIYPIEGVKVGVAAYTYETPKYHGTKTINGLPIPEETEFTINTFNYDELDDDLEEMKRTIDEMKAQGAQLVIFYVHWGQEYLKKPNEYQKKMAHYLAENGVDILFGSHPHVIQPAEIIEDNEGNKTIVFYSLGNFISNQRYELMGNRYSEDGMIAEVIWEIDLENQEGSLTLAKCIPTWVHKYHSNNKNNYEIVSLPHFLNEENLSEGTFWRAENSFNNTIEIIGKDYLNEDTGELIVYDKGQGLVVRD